MSDQEKPVSAGAKRCPYCGSTTWPHPCLNGWTGHMTGEAQPAPTAALVLDAGIYRCPVCNMPLSWTPECHLPDCRIRDAAEQNLRSNGWLSPVDDSQPAPTAREWADDYLNRNFEQDELILKYSLNVRLGGSILAAMLEAYAIKRNATLVARVAELERQVLRTGTSRLMEAEANLTRERAAREAAERKLRAIRGETPAMYEGMELSAAISALVERVEAGEAREAKLKKALQGIIEIGKRDMTNPKYDGFFESARAALRESSPAEPKEE